MANVVVRQMIYPAPPVRVPSPPPAPLVEVPLRVGGAAVSAWWQPPAELPAGGEGSVPVVLMLHGNGENLETMRQAGLFEDFRSRGAGVVAIDYPGYGRSAGTPSEAANVAAAEGAWVWLRAHAAGHPPVLAGWSLGAAVAVQVAARRRDEAMGLILASGWDRLDEVARLHFPSWLVAAALDEPYDSLAAARQVACPTLVVHGERDEIVPPALGRRLFDALASPDRQWLEVRGAGHNDLLGRPETWAAIAGFLRARTAHPA